MAIENKQAEAWVLGALLDGNDGATGKPTSDLIAASGLKASDFHFKAPRLCFEVMEKCLKQGIAPTIKNLLTHANNDLGGLTLERLLSLKNTNALTFDEFMTQTQELRRLAQLRDAAKFLNEEKVSKATKREELASKFGTYAESLAVANDVDEVGSVDLHELCDTWQQNIANGASPFIATGVKILDEAINGFVPNLNVIGGLPSVGKSALVAEIVYNVLSRGVPCGFFGLEDATAWIAKRHMARQMKLKVWEVGFRRLNEMQMEAMQTVAGELDEKLRLMTVFRRAGISADELISRARSWIVNRGVKCVFIDHGGEVNHGTNVRDRYDLAVANTYRALRDLAINYKVPVVVLAHFNRQTGDGMPTMRSFAESEYIARMARLALGLWRHPTTQKLECTILKQTEGRKGDTVELEMDVDAALVKSEGGRLMEYRDLEATHGN